jgi:hypothetical protein
MLPFVGDRGSPPEPTRSFAKPVAWKRTLADPPWLSGSGLMPVRLNAIRVIEARPLSNLWIMK